MKIFDISWTISEHITTYKDKKNVSLERIKTIESDHVNETLMTLHSHTGTHIDAPSHFLADGKSIDQLDLLACSGNAHVIDLTHIKQHITKQDIEHIPFGKDTIVLFKTENSYIAETAPFTYDFVYIKSCAAEYLAAMNIRAVGIDYLGIERDQKDHETHRAFMQRNIPIIEGLRLADVPAGNYMLWCLPLKIQGLDGAPARALLIAQ